MTDLVACLGAGTGTWTDVLQLATRPDFTRTFLIVNEWTQNSLKIDRPNIHIIVIKSDGKTSDIRDQIAQQLKGQIRDLEVAVNMDSGTGREHTALLTALMRIGVSFRFVTLENGQVEEVSYDLHLPEPENY
jgi:hypothetical protein